MNFLITKIRNKTLRKKSKYIKDLSQKNLQFHIFNDNLINKLLVNIISVINEIRRF